MTQTHCNTQPSLQPPTQTLEKNPLNIFIPMAGLGTRFASVGYTRPKPLICLLGRPMIIHLLSNLKLHPNDTIYIGLQTSSNNMYNIMSKIRAHVPHLPICEILLQEPTRGAADTLNLMMRQIPEEHMERRTVSLDCDTIYYFDILATFRHLPPHVGGVVYFEDSGTNPIFSYICLDNERLITGIKEKKPISTHANTGAYGFATASILHLHLEKLLENRLPSNGEFYTSSVIENMIKDGLDFVGIESGDFACVGTPKQLVSFVEVLKSRKKYDTEEPLIFSMDGLLNTSFEESEDGVLVFTIPDESLKVLRKLKEINFKILLSLESGKFTSSAGEEFDVASSSDRQSGKERGCLFPIESDLRKSVGW